MAAGEIVALSVARGRLTLPRRAVGRRRGRGRIGGPTRSVMVAVVVVPMAAALVGAVPSAWATTPAGATTIAGGGTPSGETPEAGPVLDAIVEMALTELPPSPVFVGLAQVVVPPGVRTTTAGTAGPRLLAVEAGTLTVAVAGPVAVTRAGGGATQTVGTVTSGGVPGGAEVVLGAGDRLAVAAGGVREVRNDGARATVYLDAALFSPTAESGSAAFTTPEGVSFQLLTGAVIDDLPRAPVAFALGRMRLDRGIAWPDDVRLGPAVAYVESGSVDLVPVRGEVRFGRAAAAAPYSAAGPLRPIALGNTATLTAGAALALPTGSLVAGRNGREVPTIVLIVAIEPTGAPAAG